MSLGLKPVAARKPPFGEKPPPGNKPATSNKPPLANKPTIKPRGNKISNMMSTFQNEPKMEPPATQRNKPIALDRSPMTGHKMNRKSSVKQLTEKYNSPPPPEEDIVSTPTNIPIPPLLPSREPVSSSSIRKDELTKHPQLPPKPSEIVSRSSSGNASTSPPVSPEPPLSPVSRSPLPPRFNRTKTIPDNSHQPNLPPRQG